MPVALNSGSAALDVLLFDLSSTLRDSQRCAESIERRLVLVQPSSFRVSVRPEKETVARVLAASAALVAEARILAENVRESRALLEQLQEECRKLRGLA
jgi:hypothetical protein